MTIGRRTSGENTRGLRIVTRDFLLVSGLTDFDRNARNGAGLATDSVLCWTRGSAGYRRRQVLS